MTRNLASADIDIDDLLGAAAPEDDDFDDLPLDHPESPQVITDIHGGVTITFLAQVFGMAKHTVRKRLADLPPMRRSRNAPIYNFVQACSFLVEPKVDIKEYLKTIRPSELPPALHKDFWDAMNKHLKWSEAAGDLWHTEDVMGVFGEVFKLVKTTSQLWVDNLERIRELTPDQRDALVRAVDGLQDDVYRALVELPKQRQTVNVAAQVDDEGLPILREELNGEAT